jgi:hypothetical protein
MKGVGIFGLVVVAVVLLLVIFILSATWIQSILKVKSQAKIYVDLSDEASTVLSLLHSRTGETSYSDALAMQYDSVGDQGEGANISSMADKMDIALIVFGKDGKIKKSYGARKYVNIMPLDMPLPGGRTYQLGLGSDAIPPEDNLTKDVKRTGA